VKVPADPEQAARIHPTAVVDEGAHIGAGTAIWHFSHVMSGARIGRDCIVGQGAFIAATALIGDRVKIQNHVSVFDGVELDDDVFCGPGVVFTNVKNPRAAVSRKHEYAVTRVCRGASLGANATILPGVVIGAHAFVGAGATVTEDVEPHALVVGVPARRVGWMSRHGERLVFDSRGLATCSSTGERYRILDGEVSLVREGALVPDSGAGT
jgi:UDP-2-acetamido-3-amino-2,3-dideoxy-glucuronate N-acetyltransferase